jgi:hypothetical protein
MQTPRYTEQHLNQFWLAATLTVQALAILLFLQIRNKQIAVTIQNALLANK